MKSALRVEKIFKHKCYSSKMSIDNDMIKINPPKKSANKNTENESWRKSDTLRDYKWRPLDSEPLHPHWHVCTDH